LLDLNMPDQDGWEAFDLMADRRPYVPVIVITARPHQYQSAVDYGIDALMEKPLNLPLLLTTITDLLAESKGDRARRLTNRDFKTVLLNPHHEVTSSKTAL
jgi:DNA-binding response OmpR family regulator